jgi:creatinine amidohydrolase
MAEIADISWVDFDERARQTEVGLVPAGAVEVYGPHMPQGTDGIVALALCRSVAERIGCLVAPLVPVGWSESLASFPGTLSVSPAAVQEYCRGIAQSLVRWGVNKILFVNGHLGNVGAIDQICLELDDAEAGRRLAQVDVWRFMQPFTADLLDSREWKFGHAGEAMTAVMLHLRPELVDMRRATRAAPAFEPDSLGLSRPYRYRDLAPEGLLGDATLATPEKGRLIFERTVDALVQFIASPRFTGVTAGVSP